MCPPTNLDHVVSKHHLIISLIPYTYHVAVINSAIKFKRNVVTTSYISDAIKALEPEFSIHTLLPTLITRLKQAGIIVMNEIGLDPGIDHLYAVKIIDEVHSKGGKIISFISYCGGLPAPEVSNNPLGYKFSWSSRGVLLALRNSARYWKDGKVSTS
jgi:saccharopine dehydrogenase (NADP+, L-glutamate forming)